MASVRALLLDLDGTLVDTAPDMAAALAAVMAAEGLPELPFRRVRCHVSDGARGLINLGFADADAERHEALKLALLAAYAERVAVDSAVFPGMQDVLRAVSAAGMPWGVVTNKPARFTDPLMAALGLTEDAACVISGDTAARAKPHPEPMLMAADILGVDPGACLYVGDARRDIEAALAAAMVPVAVRWGYIKDGDDPDDWGARFLIDAPAELLPVLALEA